MLHSIRPSISMQMMKSRSLRLEFLMMINGNLIKTSTSNFITPPRTSLCVEKTQNARSLLSMMINPAFSASRSRLFRSVKPANTLDCLSIDLMDPMG